MSRSIIWLIAGLAIAASIAFVLAPMGREMLEGTTINTSRLIFLLVAALYMVAASWAVIKANPGRMVGHVLIWIGIIALLTAILRFFGV